jgi:hypothetical protein
VKCAHCGRGIDERSNSALFDEKKIQKCLVALSVFVIFGLVIAMTICLFGCENSIDVFLFVVIYSGVCFLLIFSINKILKINYEYNSKEYYFLSYCIFPALIFCRYFFNINFRLDLLGVVLVFAASGLVRLCLFLKNRSDKEGGEGAS